MALCFNAHSVVCYLAYQATADLHMEIKPLLLGFIIPLFFSPASNPLNCNLSDNHLQYVYNPPASNPLNRVSDFILQFVGLSLAICLQPHLSLVLIYIQYPCMWFIHIIIFFCLILISEQVTRPTWKVGRSDLVFLFEF